jgi:hypothetical protein
MFWMPHTVLYGEGTEDCNVILSTDDRYRTVEGCGCQSMSRPELLSHAGKGRHMVGIRKWKTY